MNTSTELKTKTVIKIITSRAILITMVGVVEYLLIAIFDHCRGSAEIQPVRNMKLDLTGRSRATYRMRMRMEIQEKKERSFLPVCPPLKRGFANTMEGKGGLHWALHQHCNQLHCPLSIIKTASIQTIIMKETVLASGMVVGLTKGCWNLHIQGISFQLSA